MARRSVLRASDLDREHVAERLRNATAEGRLLASELEDRLGAALSARTYGELDALVADLPVLRDRRRRSTTPILIRAGFVLAVAMAVLAVVAIVTLIVLGIAGAWLAWMFFAWVLFGRKGWGRYAGCSRRYGRAYRSEMGRARSPRSGPITL